MTRAFSHSRDVPSTTSCVFFAVVVGVVIVRARAAGAQFYGEIIGEDLPAKKFLIIPIGSPANRYHGWCGDGLVRQLKSDGRGEVVMSPKNVRCVVVFWHIGAV